MEEMYGEQNQRSYSVGVSWIFLSYCARSPRSANVSAGLVNALTKSWRNSPGCPEILCATESGTITALSSAPPVERMPVTFSGQPRDRPPGSARNGSTLIVCPGDIPPG